MNMKKTLTLVLTIAGLNIFAGEPAVLNSKNDNGSLVKENTLFSKKKLKMSNRFGFNTASFSGSGKDYDEATMTAKGLFLNFGIFFPPDGFCYSDSKYGKYESGDPTYGLGFDFEVGSYFRFAKIQDGKFGIGMRASWLSLSYTSLTDGPDKWRVGQIRPVHLGPQFSFALNEEMALDAYYILGFNLTNEFGAIDDPINNQDYGISSTLTGLSHEIGFAFRYQMYSLGFGYRMGKLSQMMMVVDGETIDQQFLDEGKFSVNTWRMALGFKF